MADLAAVVGDALRGAMRGSGRQRLRRLSWLVLWLLVWPVWAGGTLMCLGLDHLFWGRFRRQAVAAPIFIVGNHRTGSTFLHRLLAMDPGFVTTRLHDLLLPSILQKRTLDLLVRLDSRVGHPLARVIAWLDRQWLPDYRKVHPMGLDLPEEDEFLLLYLV